MALTTKPYDKPAAGLEGVTSTLSFSKKQMGPLRTLKVLGKVNQPGGFDCPGCAWPEPKGRGVVEFCENGARAVAHEATTRRVGPLFFEEFTLEKLEDKSDLWLEAQGRLTHPMVKRKGSNRYEPISWEEAFSLIAERLKALDSANEAVFYTSGRTSNEAAFLYQLLVRRFGTNNLPDCSNMCHESSGKGLSKVIGVGKGTVTLEDFDEADAIFILGQNPGTNHPRMLSTLEKARKRGAEIVAINPIKEAGLLAFAHPQKVSGLFGKGTPLATLYLQVKIGGDIALLKGIMKEVLAAEEEAPGTVLDHAFLREHTTGFEEFRRALDEVSWEEIVESSGLSREEIRAAADIYKKARRVIACWAMGLTQHKFGVANVREIVNLLLLRGNLGKPGAGVCPVRGHSNVQGDRTMGIVERPQPGFLDKLEEVFGFSPPREPGYDTWETLRAMAEGKVKAFFAMAGNFARATPDTEGTERALRKVRLTVQVSTKLNRSHVASGEEALILPCLGRTERDETGGKRQFVTVENSMGIVHRSEGALPPASEHLRSEPAIVAGLGKALFGDNDPVDWDHLLEDYDRIRDLIAKVVPGFQDMNRKVRAKDGFLLPNSARDRRFLTESGKAEFTVQALPKIELADGELLMMTIRAHDQYNTTVYTLDDRYRGVYGERRVVLMHPDDMKARGLEEGDRVALKSRFQGEERRAEGFFALRYDIPKGCVATYFPEANVLVPRDSVADESHTPASKSVVVRVEKAADAAGEGRGG